jgi:hypothetical protein
MELLVLLLIGLLILIVVLPFVAMSKASAAKRSVDDLFTRLLSVENDVRTLRRQNGSAAIRPRAQSSEPAARPETSPPPLPAISVQPTPEQAKPPKPVEAKPPPPPTPVRAPIDWEQFMGAKLFAWIGGVALFLGVAFFVKYSFEHNLIPPEVRVAIGFVVGVGLLVGGVLLKRKENAVHAQTLCATGVLVLYSVTFACRSHLHFAIRSPDVFADGVDHGVAFWSRAPECDRRRHLGIAVASPHRCCFNWRTSAGTLRLHRASRAVCLLSHNGNDGMLPILGAAEVSWPRHVPSMCLKNISSATKCSL